MALSTIVIGVISGLIGWVLAEFFGKPFRKGVEFMIEARTLVVVHGNVPARFKAKAEDPTQAEVLEFSEADEERLKDAEKALREMGARLQAFAVTERPVSWTLRLLGTDLKEVGVSLLLLSNSLQVYGNQRAYASARVEKALNIAARGTALST